MSEFRLKIGIISKKMSIAKNDLILVPKIIRESNDETTTKSYEKSRYLC